MNDINRHPWRKEIQAWLNGEDLEFMSITGNWITMNLSENQERNPLTCTFILC